MPKKTKHKFDEDSENALINFIVNQEYQTSKSARQAEIADFESLIQMLEGVRAEKNYSWMSDVDLGYLAGKILVDASNWANQYFQSRDFVDVKLEGNEENDVKKCSAAKKCINQTLNNRRIYHYHKYIRGRTINSLFGQIYGVCWWEKKTKPYIKEYQFKEETLDLDVFGMPITSEDQVPAVRRTPTPIYDEEIILDQFNYDVVDPRNVFMDSTYQYSVQDKPWLIFRFENTYEQLKTDEDKYEYFNLDFVKELIKSQSKTETAKETYLKDEQDREPTKPVSKKVDRLLRFGKAWAIVKERDENGYPKIISPAYHKNGDIPEKAELVNAIIELVIVGGNKILIRFQPNPFRDSRGNNYYPVIRGWCYIHPTKDIGLSDGKYLKEIEIAINDHFNMGSDRVKLATLPTLKGKKYALEDNDTIYFEPEHVMELEDPVTDLQEFKLSDNVSGTIEMIQMLEGTGDRTTAIFPSTTGELPRKASTTATAIAGSEQRQNSRANYKSLTFEYTFLLDFYWVILQMTHQFASEKTAWKMMGDDAPYFDPDPDYSYTPVTSNIETEFNKYRKIQLYDQTIGRLSGLAKVVPEIIPIIAHIIRRQLELQGDEYQTIAKMLENFSKAKPRPEGSTPNQPEDIKETPTSNQMGQPMSPAEEGTREQWSQTK